VTLAPVDNNYVLSGAQTYEVPYEIKKMVIDLDVLFAEELQFESNGGDQRSRPFWNEFGNSDDSIKLKDFVNYEVDEYITFDNIYCPPGSSEWQAMSPVIVEYKGRYKLSYQVSIIDPSKYILRYKDNECNSAKVVVRFEIV
jgi:hypothetical protein